MRKFAGSYRRPLYLLLFAVLIIIKIESKAYENGTLKKNSKVMLVCELPEDQTDYQHVEVKLKDLETNEIL